MGALWEDALGQRATGVATMTVDQKRKESSVGRQNNRLIAWEYPRLQPTTVHRKASVLYNG